MSRPGERRGLEGRRCVRGHPPPPYRSPRDEETHAIATPALVEAGRVRRTAQSALDAIVIETIPEGRAGYWFLSLSASSETPGHLMTGCIAIRI